VVTSLIAFVLFVIGIYIFVRSEYVYRFRRRMSREEAQWLANHPDSSKGSGFGRYDSLPSYDRMMVEFWKPLSYYERDLKSIWEYHK